MKFLSIFSVLFWVGIGFDLLTTHKGHKVGLVEDDDLFGIDRDDDKPGGDSSGSNFYRKKDKTANIKLRFLIACAGFAGALTVYFVGYETAAYILLLAGGGMGIAISVLNAKKIAAAKKKRG